MTAALACPHCGSPSTLLAWARLPDRLFRTTSERFDLRRCKACAIHFLAPVPDDLARFYPKGYWTGPSEGRGLHGRLTALYRRAMLFDHVRFVRGVVARQRAGGIDVRWLDIGCGDGSLLEAVGVRPCAGFDFSAEALAQVRARGIFAASGSVLDAPFRDGSFSIVSMFHFLEHVVPPVEYLRAARRLLRADGSLVVQVPNARSVQAKLLRARWAGHDVPRHLMSYTPRHLREVVERAGFTVVRATQHSLRDNPTTLVNSIAPGLYPPARPPAWAANLAYLALTIAAVPITSLEALFGLGATIMIEARPRA